MENSSEDMYEPVSNNGKFIINKNGMLFQNKNDGSLIYAPITNEVTDFLETEKENKISEGSVESKSTKLPSSTFDSGRIWSRNATLQLIHLYSQHQQQFASTTLRNDAVWDLIKDKMEHEGFRYSSVQCKDRFKYLKISYGKKIDSMRTTGASCIKFEFFDEMDQLFGKKPNFNPPIIASSSRRTVESSTNDSSDSLEGEIPRKKAKSEKQDELISFIKENAKRKEEARKLRHEERIQVQREAIDSFKAIMSQVINK